MKELKLKFWLFMTGIAIKFKRLNLAIKCHQKSSKLYTEIFKHDWREES